MSTSLGSKRAMLAERAALLARAREFFADRGVLEVDTPLLSRSAPIDAHIEVMRVLLPEGECGYLHTSPEYALKRLLSEGVGDLYQMGHVFREGEWGALHNPEFTMVEWYRLGISLTEMIEETRAFIDLFLPDQPINFYNYRALLQEHAGIDSLEEERDALAQRALKLIPHLPEEAEGWERDTLLHSLMSFVVEPHLGKGELSVVEGFPASQAALSLTEQTERGEEVAMRFEIYSSGIELANGYQELTSAEEQRKRFEEANSKRVAMGKEQLPVDEQLLAALESGLPKCCGVAVGFDRLLLLRIGAKSLREVLPFPWEERR